MLKRYSLIPALCLSLSAVHSSSEASEVIFSEDFQDADYYGWTLSGRGAGTITYYGGNYSIRLTNKKVLTRTISTENFKDVSISMSMAASSLEGSEYCTGEVYINGQWQSVVSVANGADDGYTMYTGNLTQTALDNNPSLPIRFRAVSSGWGDYCWGDDVIIQGTENTGENEPGILNISTSAVQFSQLEVGQNESTAITISNTGNGDLTINDISSPSTPFSLQSETNCETTLSSGTSCNFSAVFSPSDAGNFQSSVTITATDNNPETISLAGSAYIDSSAPQLSVTPTSYNFGNQAINQSQNTVIQITNSGDAALEISSLAISGDSVFGLSHNCDLNSPALNLSCSATVSFTPTSPETNYSATLAIASNGGNQNINLSGSGENQNSGECDYDCFPTGGGNVNRSSLTYSVLQTAGNGTKTDYSAYAVPQNAANPDNTFRGRLSFTGVERSFELAPTRSLRNDATFGNYSTWNSPDPHSLSGNNANIRKLPNFSFEFVQHGTHIIPVTRGLVVETDTNGDDVDGNLWWEYILEPGRVWQEDSDNGYSRASIPFALQEAGANCTHNGVLTFLFNQDSVSKVSYQIAGETCAYLRFNMWGQLDASYTSGTVSNEQIIKSAYETEVNRRIPTKSIDELDNLHPGIKSNLEAGFYTYANPSWNQDENDVSIYGVAVDGVNYTSGCKTRQGDYPYCSVMAFPSYSVAKSMAGGIGLMALEKQYPGVKNEKVSALIPECPSSKWGDVTLEHTLDMATGNYTSDGWEEDEGNNIESFLGVFTHTEKISHACNTYARKATPGSKWVYHTSDTYILGAAMDAYLENQQGSGKDFYSDFLVENIWKPLNLSPAMYTSSRTYDNAFIAQTGLGLTFHHDDLVKVGQFLYNNGSIDGQQKLDSNMLAAIFQQSPKPGLDADALSGDYSQYDQGFWLRNTAGAQACSNDGWVPFMSGWGGVALAVMPNGVIYYHVTDSHDYWIDWAMSAVNNITSPSLCNSL